MRTLTPLSLALLCLAWLECIVAVDSWHMYWPSVTYQCETVNVSVTGGTPPWAIGIIPIGGSPLIWTLRDPGVPVNATNPYTWSIPLQLQGGTTYSVMISDAHRYNTALENPTPIQIVQNSTDQACFSSANPAHKDYTFQTSGMVQECSDDFTISWQDSAGLSPYSFTVVPLDGSYNPWDVALNGSGVATLEANWQVNMTVGTRFTIVMSDTYGFGRGGVGQIYQVVDGPSQTCITQGWLGTAAWPYQVTATSLPMSSTPWSSTVNNVASTITEDDAETARAGNSTSTSTSTSNNDSSQVKSGRLSSGVIAGIAVGAGIGLAALAGLIVFLLLRRKERRENRPTPVDLLPDDRYEDAEPKVEPYRPIASATPATMGYGERELQPESPYTPYERGEFGVASPGMLMGYTNVASGSSSSHPHPHATSPSEKSGASGNHLPRRPSNPANSPSDNVTQPASSSSIRGIASTPEDKSSAPPSTRALPSPPVVEADEEEGDVEYRRHTDSGLAPSQQQGEERRVVDLPPLYDDVPSRSDTVRRALGEAGPSRLQ